MRVLERDIKAACLDYLDLCGAFVWNNPTGCTRVGADRWVHFGKLGSADIIGLLPDGRFICVETKASKGGRLSDAQKCFLDKVRQHGGVAIVASSTADIEAELVQGGYISPVLTF
jgi:hypothetical protein